MILASRFRRCPVAPKCVAGTLFCVCFVLAGSPSSVTAQQASVPPPLPPVDTTQTALRQGQTPFASAEAVLQRFKAVTGGAAWDLVRAIHTKATVTAGGLTGVSDEWDDAVDGRTVSFNAIGSTRDTSGFDGKRAWHQDDSGPAHPDDGAAERQDAVSDAYDTSNSYWYPNRLPGKFILLAPTTDADGTPCDVVRVEPQGGTPYQMWFDHATGLLAKTIRQSAAQTSTTRYFDYRPVGVGSGDARIELPYKQIQGDGAARYDLTLQVASIEVNAAPPAGIFAVPSQFKADYSFDHGATSVTVPMQYLDDHVFFPLKINGHDETAMFDTGGSFIVSTQAARELGMKAQGAFEIAGNGASSVSGSLARADTVQIGGLTIEKPIFTTIPYFSGEGGEPVAGSELLDRFVIAIDFDDSTMTFTRPDAFHSSGSGTVVPFRFHDGHMPEVDGSIDGVPGTFTIDTGDNLALTLNGPFTQANRLMDKYKPKFAAISGYGIGGADPAYVVRTRTLTLGGVTAHDRVTYLRGGKTGAGSDRSVAGNVGNGVLRQFNLTFDYPNERIIFEPNKRYGDADVYMRTGIVFDIDTVTPTISDVVPGSPAADAGLSPGDTVLSINGVSMQNSGFGEQFQTFNYKPAGSSVSMQVMLANGQTKTVTMVLRDLV